MELFLSFVEEEAWENDEEEARSPDIAGICNTFILHFCLHYFLVI